MHIVTADGNFFIMLIVGLFWVVAQIAGAAGKKKPAPPRPTFDEEDHPTPEDPFADLMRKLSGVQEIKVPTPPEPVKIPAQAAPPERLTPPRMSKSTREATPPAEPNRMDMPQKSGKPAKEIAEIDIPLSISSVRSSLQPMKSPAMKLSFQGSEKSTGNVPTLGNIINPSDKRTLRRAMLSHIIFSPPKALEGMK